MQLLAVRRWLAVCVEDGEGAPDAVVGRVAALDLLDGVGDCWRLPAEIQFDSDHDGLRDAHFDRLAGHAHILRSDARDLSVRGRSIRSDGFTSAAVPVIKNYHSGDQHSDNRHGGEPSPRAPNWLPRAGLLRARFLLTIPILCHWLSGEGGVASDGHFPYFPVPHFPVVNTRNRKTWDRKITSTSPAETDWPRN